jgi:dienelactone hydrolase
MFELPYHFQRRPRLGPVRNFISGDVGRSMEAVHQALAEINSVVNWLRAQGCPRVCLMGLSLGAWLAGLVACHNDGIDCAVFITPVSRMDRMIDEVAFCDPIRRALLSQPMDLSRFNLKSHKPKLTRGAMLLVAAEYDVFVPMETTQELWAAWGNPEIWTLPHGHISILASSTTMKRASKWIGIRLRIPNPQGSSIRPDQVLG